MFIDCINFSLCCHWSFYSCHEHNCYCLVHKESSPNTGDKYSCKIQYEQENYTTVYTAAIEVIIFSLWHSCSCLCLSVHIKWWIIQSESLMRQWIKATIHWTTLHIMNCTIILDLELSDMLLHQDWREIRSTQQ